MTADYTPLPFSFSASQRELEITANMTADYTLILLCCCGVRCRLEITASMTADYTAVSTGHPPSPGMLEITANMTADYTRAHRWGSFLMLEITAKDGGEPHRMRDEERGKTEERKLVCPIDQQANGLDALTSALGVSSDPP